MIAKLDSDFFILNSLICLILAEDHVYLNKLADLKILTK